PTRQLPCSTPFPYTTLFRSPASRTYSDIGSSTICIPELIERCRIFEKSLFAILTENHLTLCAISVQPIVSINCGTNVQLLIILLDRKSTRLNSSHVKISYAV